MKECCFGDKLLQIKSLKHIRLLCFLYLMKTLSCNKRCLSTFVCIGNYSSGSVLLTGSIEVVIPKGIRILASTKRAEYEGGRSSWYLFYFIHCFRCSIIGDGILDGQGREYVIDIAEDW